MAMDIPLPMRVIAVLAIVGGLTGTVGCGAREEVAAKLAVKSEDELAAEAEKKRLVAHSDMWDFMAIMDRRIGGDLAALRKYEPMSNEERFKHWSELPCRQGASPSGECLDPWGQPYRLLFKLEGYNKGEYAVYSLGPNGLDDSRGGDDMLVNRDLKAY